LRERGLLPGEVSRAAPGGRRVGRAELVLVGEQHLRILLTVGAASALGGGSGGRVEVELVLLGGPGRG
jgi:hypothetical protein